MSIELLNSVQFNAIIVSIQSSPLVDIGTSDGHILPMETTSRILLWAILNLVSNQ